MDYFSCIVKEKKEPQVTCHMWHQDCLNSLTPLSLFPFSSIKLLLNWAFKTAHQSILSPYLKPFIAFSWPSVYNSNSLARNPHLYDLICSSPPESFSLLPNHLLFPKYNVVLSCSRPSCKLTSFTHWSGKPYFIFEKFSAITLLRNTAIYLILFSTLFKLLLPGATFHSVSTESSTGPGIEWNLKCCLNELLKYKFHFTVSSQWSF